MKKIKFFPAPHVEVRLHVSEQMEKDWKECQKRRRSDLNDMKDYCVDCSWYDVEIGAEGACDIPEVKRQMGGAE